MASGMILQVTENRLPQLLVSFPREVSAVIRKTAFDVQREAQNRAPVKTGTLRASIGAAPTPGGNPNFDWTVTVGAEYGIYVEYGTRYMHAQPYFNPAIQKAWGPFQEAFATLARHL